MCSIIEVLELLRIMSRRSNQNEAYAQPDLSAHADGGLTVQIQNLYNEKENNNRLQNNRIVELLLVGRDHAQIIYFSLEECNVCYPVSAACLNVTYLLSLSCVKHKGSYSMCVNTIALCDEIAFQPALLV